MCDLIYRDAYEGGYDHGEVIRAEIREGFGTHQIALLDYQMPEGTFTQFAPGGTPMAFRWSVSPTDVRTFYGYVNHHEYLDTNTIPGTLVLRFYCIGISQPLNQPSPHSWRSVTGSYIARQTAHRHRLRAIVHQSKEILPYWTAGRDSDFTMLNRLAEETGARFWVDGASLYFVDPEVLLTFPGRSIAATYQMDRLPDDTIKEIWVVSGDMTPVPDAPFVRKVYGIDGSNRLIEADSVLQTTEHGLALPGSTRIYPRSVSSLDKARLLNQRAALAGSWSKVRTITAGDARARVGSLVSLGGVALNQNYHGTWLVSDIIHVIDQSQVSGLFQYHTQIDLTRNQKDGLYFTATSTARNVFSEVPAVLRGKTTWESANLGAVYV